MAKLGNFITVSDIRGKVGGTTYTRGRSGAVMRVRKKPKNPRSTAQTDIRNALTQSSRGGVGLTPTEINDWKAYALTVVKHNRVSGAAYNPSWLNIWNEYVMNLALVGFSGTPPTTPPASPYSGDGVTMTAASSAPNTITFTASGANATDSSFILFVGLVPGTARTPFLKMARFVDHFHATGGTLTHDITGLITGKTYAVAYKEVNNATGQALNTVFLGGVLVT